MITVRAGDLRRSQAQFECAAHARRLEDPHAVFNRAGNHLRPETYPFRYGQPGRSTLGPSYRYPPRAVDGQMPFHGQRALLARREAIGQFGQQRHRADRVDVEFAAQGVDRALAFVLIGQRTVRDQRPATSIECCDGRLDLSIPPPTPARCGTG